jgi:hypothetical protein
MNFEYAYLIVVGLLLLVAMFYVSPYELRVNEDDDDD